MTITIDKKYRWHQSKNEEVKYWYIGSETAVTKFISFYKSNFQASVKDIGEKLLKLVGNFAVILLHGDKIVATVDKIRSYPVFYVHDGGKFFISNSARALKNECGLSEIDKLSLLEFRMSGYVTGRETIYRHLYQLQSGELLIWDNSALGLSRQRYYIFYPKDIRQEKEDILIEELGEITNKIFHRVIDHAKGRMISVPLSGGLDSRLILCKLKELGYDNLRAYSYGPKGNWEAKAAKHVAEKLGVPWKFYPLLRGPSKKFFWSEERKKYWHFADGLSTTPTFQDIASLIERKKGKDLPEDAVIINGQSGDFITGGHIPSVLVQKKVEMHKLIRAIVEKHMALWIRYKTPDNYGLIEDKISDLLGEVSEYEYEKKDIAHLFEFWEYQERQCKYVVNHQRSYDYIGFDWELPLWQDEYILFWENIPVELKFEQHLYKRYLRTYNYNGLFKEFNPVIWRWPGMTIAFVPIARLIGLLAGNRRKETFYNYFRYLGHSRHQWGAYSIKYFLKETNNARHGVSFFVETWIKENIFQ